MKRVFAYLRVSTAQQLDGDGYERQRAACIRLADQNGWSIIRFFEEQESGSIESLDRPRLLQCLELCGEQFDTILVERVDRIARDLIVAELFFRECKQRGIKVYSADTGEELVNAEGDPTRKLIRQILGALSEWVKSELCRKLQAGRRRKVRETGRPCGGAVPFGMHADPHIRARERAIIQVILRLITVEGYSLSEVARELTKLGYTNPSGGKGWARSTVSLIYHANKTEHE